MEFGAGPTWSAIFFLYIIFSAGSIKSVGNIHPDPDMSHDLSKISKILHAVHGHECHTTVYVRLVNYKHTIGHFYSVYLAAVRVKMPTHLAKIVCANLNRKNN